MKNETLTYELCPCGSIMWSYDMRIEHDKHFQFAKTNPSLDVRNIFLWKNKENKT